MANAQDLQVSGVVTDRETGDPLPGVNVVVENTMAGIITDPTGKYSITVAGDGVLTFSFIGYESERVEVNGRTSIDVQLRPKFEELDEVVVVGYGTMRKSDLTGALTRVQEKEDVASQYSGVDALLQGRASGVNVSANAGNLGGAVSVRIRGTNSLRGNNEPLYVIDGVIVNSAGEDVKDASSDANELQTDQNGLTGLNVRDIESIEILKDASATAIYGSRGANGVVLITTKSGQNFAGKPSMNAYVNYEIADLSRKMDLLDGISWAEYQNEYLETVNDKARYYIDNGQVYPLTWNDTIPVIGDTPYAQFDWQDEVYKLSKSVNAGFSVSGKSDQTRYYISGSFSDENGIVEKTEMKTVNLRINLDQNFTKRLSMENRASFMYQNGSFAQAGSRSGGNRSFTKQVLNYRPVVGYSDDNINDLDLEISNPLAWLANYDDLAKETRINLSSVINYKITENLTYSLRGGLDYRTKDRERWYGTEIFKGNLSNGYATYSGLTRYSYTLDNLLSYNVKFDWHRINATLGTTYDGTSYKATTYEVADFPIKSLRTLAPQAGQLAMSPYAIDLRDESIFSVLGRVNYSYRDRYILTASMRTDQSSKFRPGNQTGYFPSFAAAWRISKERFMRDLDFIYNLKIRLGWGQVGNSSIPPYQTLFTYFTNYYVNNSGSTILGTSPARIPNVNLTWETTSQLNGGIDFAFFEGRINGMIDVYSKKTEDLLLEKPIPESTGYSVITVNQGTIQNRGVEFNLDGVLFQNNNISLSIGGNIGINKNKILKLGLPSETIYINGEAYTREFYLGSNVSTGTYFKAPANIFMVGEEIGLFWGLESDGIVQEEDVASGTLPTYKGNPLVAGDVLFVDHNGDGNIDDWDKTFIGNPNPDFFYGFSVDFNYKKFSLYLLFDGSYGNDIVNGYNLEMGYAEGQSKNIQADAYAQAWRADAPSNTYPRIGYRDNSSFFCDRQVEDGSYLRLNNLTLGYELPALKNIGNAMLTLSARNLFTLTKYSGFDPQVTSFLFEGTIMGVDWVGTPNVRTFTLGLNLNFF